MYIQDRTSVIVIRIDSQLPELWME